MPGPHMPVESWLSKEELAELDGAIKAFGRATTETGIDPSERRKARDQVRTFLLTLRQRHQSA